MKHAPYTQRPTPGPHPVSLSRNRPVKSQQMDSNGLHRLWRVIAVMLDSIGIAPHWIEQPSILARQRNRSDLRSL